MFSRLFHFYQCSRLGCPGMIVCVDTCVPIQENLHYVKRNNFLTNRDTIKYIILERCLRYNRARLSHKNAVVAGLACFVLAPPKWISVAFGTSQHSHPCFFILHAQSISSQYIKNLLSSKPISSIVLDAPSYLRLMGDQPGMGFVKHKTLMNSAR